MTSPSRFARWARPAGRVLRLIEGLAWTAFFVFALTVLALKYAVLPKVGDYRERIAQSLSKSLGLKAEIGELSAGWDGLHPELALSNVRFLDAQGRTALQLPSLEVQLSWSSIPFMDLRFKSLELSGANLAIRRTRDNKLLIAGITLDQTESSGNMSDWILGQERIVIRDSRLVWTDERRAAPELVLSNIQLRLENRGNRHRFALIADPPAHLASRLDVRGDLSGDSLNALNLWRGSFYADLAMIDLAAWRAWIDAPADVRSGTGRLRAWARFGEERLEEFTADVGLSGVKARLARDLPVLELARVDGRVAAREIAVRGKTLGFLRLGAKQVNGFEVSGKQVALRTANGVALPAADFSMRTVAAHGNEPREVNVEADKLQLEPLALLIEHLPLDAALRRAMAEFKPRGAVDGLQFRWRGEFDAPVDYSARGRFRDLALEARGPVPGLSGFTGQVEATPKGGSLTLASRNSAVLLPKVFDEASLPFEKLDGRASWVFNNGVPEVKLEQLAFANADAEGTASGTWKRVANTPGLIDLQARLTRGEGTRVFRYLPKTIPENTRRWVQGAVETGRIEDARFTVKGNLYDFPFRDSKAGLFRVVCKIDDVKLHYADAWPRLQKINGELILEGMTMQIKANQATYESGGMIAKLGKTDVRMPDLAGRPHILEMSGVADGPTQAFLQFISESPVDRYIDKFTETMRATGNGKLALKLTLPIEESSNVKLTGEYRFLSNDVRLDQDLPQLSKVNGSVAFTERGITLKNVAGQALGGPFTVAGGTRDGVIALNAQGSFTMPGLRTWLPQPVLSHASGGAPWRAGINIRRRAGEVVVESTLAGVAIDLPAPMAKAAAETWPLRVSKTAVPNVRNEEEFNVSVGRALSARIQRRIDDAGRATIVRGAMGVGDAPPTMPRNGVAVALAASAIDVEQWSRRMDGTPVQGPAPSAVAPAAGGATSGSATSGNVAAAFDPWAAFPISTVSIRADTITAYGKALTQARINANRDGPVWTANVAAQEMTGEVSFRPSPGNNQGRLTARLKHLLIPQNAIAQVDATFDRSTEALPGIDIQVDNFEVGTKKLGSLQLAGFNQGGEWRLQRIALDNPDGKLTGTGVWRVRSRNESRRRFDMDFALDAVDAGKLLDRLGFTGTVRSGTGRIDGALGWDGSPLALDLASLRGNLNMKMERGQFLKADPGVGKLLGIMSLQALPRRLALDFRDVFSEGFVFDQVNASARIERGLLTTNDFKMASPTAGVVMTGEVDLARETQALKVVVLPNLSGGMGSVITAMLGNPILGLATLLAQLALKEPLSKAFAFEYSITGTFADPKIAKVQNTATNNAGTSDVDIGRGPVAGESK